MGLDMYLNAEVYVKDWRHNYPDGVIPEKTIAKTIENMFDMGDKALEPTNVIFEAAYWRKANAIHKWFVDNVQSGADDCKPYSTNTTELRELIKTCERVLAHPNRAEELLPVQGGFFFGGTEYDEWYMESLRDTVEQLTKAIAFAEKIEERNMSCYFTYQSSW